MPLYDDDGNELTPEQAMQYLDEYQQQAAPPQAPGWRRDLERRLQEATTQAQQAQQAQQQAERKLAFFEAGVPLDNPLATYFVNGYQGDLTADAIKAEAAKVGLIQTQQPQPNPTAEQAAAWQPFTEATQGMTVPGERNWDGELAAAKTPADVDRIANERAAASGSRFPGVVQD